MVTDAVTIGGPDEYAIVDYGRLENNPQLVSLAFDGATAIMEHNNSGAGSVIDIASNAAIAIWHKPDAAFGSRDGFLCEMFETANPANALYSVRMHHNVSPVRTTLKCTDDTGLVEEREWESLQILGAWNLTALDFSSGGVGAGVVLLYQNGFLKAETTILTTGVISSSNNLAKTIKVGRSYLGTIHSVMVFGQRLLAGRHMEIFEEGPDFDPRIWHSNKHWYRFGYQRLSLGQDFGRQDNGPTGAPALPAVHRDLGDESVALTFDDVSNDAPVVTVRGETITTNSMTFDTVDATIGLETAPGVFDFGIPGPGGVFSLMAWVKPLTSSTSATILALGDIGIGGNRFVIQQNTGGTGAVFVDIESLSPVRIKRYTTTSGDPPIFSDDRWFKIIVTFDGNNDPTTSLQIYLDSVLVTANRTTNQDISALTNLDMEGSIGGYKSVGALPGKHRIHQVATWNSELSAAEVVAIYNGGDASVVNLLSNSGDYVSASNLKSWWQPCRQLSPNLGHDYGPQGVHMNSEVNVSDSDCSADFPTP